MNESQSGIPFSPAQIKEKFLNEFDPLMIDAVNNLLAKNWNDYQITLKQDEIMREYLRLRRKAGRPTTSQRVYESNGMDFEDVFRKKGWEVDHDQPGYCENYDAFFVFKPKKK